MTDTLLFKRFKLIKNSKNPTNEWALKNREKSIRVKKISGNAGIPTGKINNITVLDFDFHKVDDRDNKFLDRFNNFINDIDTYTVKTANGGFHLYLEYDKDIATTTNAKYHIDVRNDGGYVVSPGSIVDGKEYTVLRNRTIKKIPLDIKEWLLDTIYTIKNKPTIKNKKDKNINMSSQFKYNITNEELESFIKKLNNDTWTNTDLFLKYSTFCKYFNIQDIWDKYNKLHPNYDYDNNINKYWNNLKPTDEIIDDIFNKKYVNYYKYKPSPISNIKANKYIDSKKLGYDFINESNYIIKSDTGTGKTTSFKHYVKNNNLKFVSIVSRVTLANEQYKIFNEHGVDCISYSLRLEDANDKKFKNDENIVITIDSIIHLYAYRLYELCDISG
jgi:hypothetical protein